MKNIFKHFKVNSTNELAAIFLKSKNFPTAARYVGADVGLN